MSRFSALPIVFVLSTTIAGHGAAQATHLIKLEADKSEEAYHFVPATVVAHANDVLVFRVVSGEPHNITFEGAGLSPQAHAALNEALRRRSADLASPLLTAPGAEYRVIVPAIPAGRYRFFCLPHRAYDERGELVVE
ncbi:MAG TPA: plastocyanin/azurin family copper-binding protein [Gemmatimonadales bacterium]|jgi:plastocyanin